MAAAILTNQLPALASPFDSGGINSVSPSASQMSNGFIPNIDNIAAEQQNYLHRASTTAIWLAQQLGLALPFNPISGASVVATPKGGIVSLKDSVTGNTQFYVALNAMPIGYTDPSADPTNWQLINFNELAKFASTPVTLASASTVDIGAALSGNVTISGTTTIASFGTVYSGAIRFVTYSGAVPITYNVTSMQLVGGVSRVNAVGDVSVFQSLGSGNWKEIVYQPTSGGHAPQTFTPTMAANACTISALNSSPLIFRSATLGSGAVSTVAIPSANLVIPAGATLGTVNGVLSGILVVEMNNGGTREFAVCNMAGGLQCDERNLISTTAISAGATAANVWYSTTGRSNLPYKVIGYFESTQATAGQWATAASLVQSAFGEALTALNSAGYGQTRQTVTRTSGTIYYNTTNKPIKFMPNMIPVGAGIYSYTVTINGAAYAINIYGPSAGYSDIREWTVMPGESYSVTNGINSTIGSCAEIR